MKYGFARCDSCDLEFEASSSRDRLCPHCVAIEDAQYANGSTEPAPEFTPWKYSRAAMRERLGVTGNLDE